MACVDCSSIITRIALLVHSDWEFFPCLKVISIGNKKCLGMWFLETKKVRVELSLVYEIIYNICFVCLKIYAHILSFKIKLTNIW